MRKILMFTNSCHVKKQSYIWFEIEQESWKYELFETKPLNFVVSKHSFLFVFVLYRFSNHFVSDVPPRRYCALILIFFFVFFLILLVVFLCYSQLTSKKKFHFSFSHTKNSEQNKLWHDLTLKAFYISWRVIIWSLLLFSSDADHNVNFNFSFYKWKNLISYLRGEIMTNNTYW